MVANINQLELFNIFWPQMVGDGYIRGHDFEYWIPLEFDVNGNVKKFAPFVETFQLDIYVAGWSGEVLYRVCLRTWGGNQESLLYTSLENSEGDEL